ncbi:nucleotidyltransferase domain-containing protein [Mycetocola tolaasinivorans]|uniref:Nucleotidyltransferase domain-containing protein n=2 Tax=Mycetocola tolaasinivorans TaxID=76635 RepID=A0A3L7A7P6_9MICO|nr:nucleotidyltransferase domain-containing protein [Mycetocola tolaasinivorans]
MRLQNPFAAMSTTGLDSQVLTVLCRSDQFLTVDQIHRLLPEDGSAPGVRKSVVRLTNQGVVAERSVGRNLAFAFNREHLLADAILQIADARNTLIARLQRVIATWEVQPLTVKIFGSAARQQMRDDSDIDVLMVFPDGISEDALDDAVGELSAKLHVWTGNDVRPLLYRASEVRSASIFDSILAEGIDVAGDPTWLRRHLRHQREVA